MNEVRALIEAFDEACASGVRCALATLVSVEGSSYRRPGARMLVGEGGACTGSISAGCLEGDVVEHARGVIRAGAAKLVEYDTASTGEEMAWGLGLGCNGIVRVLVEPLAPRSSYVAALRRSCASGGDAAPTAVATVYHLTPSTSTHEAGRVEIGSRLFVGVDGEVVCESLGGELARLIEGDLRASAREGSSGVRVYEHEGGAVKVFCETLTPPVPLVVFGAGHDALPVVELARGLGWHTEVVDPQARPASRARFASSDRVTLARPEEVGAHVKITPRTLTLLMTHNYSHDLALLKFLLASPARYVGVMGPRKRTERMLSELAEGDAAIRLEEADRSRLYAPAGLDIGANAPAEIALSITAEMRAVLDGRRGGILRERRGSIHGRLSDGEGVPVLEADAGSVASA
ncbi:MAG: XdhC family protein [Acidobacteria bacterium]|nr:XdhC family protein [Acidobacteriota bacterium]MCA1620575.1 XdhC family protein [Acidobacteriota bacterium]